MKLIIFHSNLEKIGGIATFTYNLCKRLCMYYDIVFMYKEAETEQLSRISEYVKTEKYNPNKNYECDICILASSFGEYPETVEAKRYLQMIHACYSEIPFQFKKYEKTTDLIAVSKAAKKSFLSLFPGEKVEVIYNMLDTVENHKVLKLFSATRLTNEKGYKRMIKLAHILHDNNIKFKWYILTNTLIKKEKLEEIEYVKPTHDMQFYYDICDYGVQLSDTESWCYFINECLQRGIPVIATDFSSIYESVQDGYNGYILDKELSNLDLNKIVNKIPKDFEYKELCTPEIWFNYLGGAEYDERRKKMKVLIKAIKDYTDIELDKDIKAGDEYEVTEERAEVIVNAGFAIKLAVTIPESEVAGIEGADEVPEGAEVLDHAEIVPEETAETEIPVNNAGVPDGTEETVEPEENKKSRKKK